MEELHPTVAAFKEFINKHPSLLREIRKSGKSWQEYYEKWVLLGEDDPYWEAFKEDLPYENEKETKASGKDSELIGQIMKYTSNLDINKMQGQVNQLSKAITTIQDMIEQFKQTQKSTPTKRDPFNWMKD
ncbi:YlbD family protein [Oceanobacillus massiliensis]|uniref:YlbD family protein n=1 Tax=Oceanobacillus massiliensis TaxID=1465765 RepID=UPI003018141C